MIYWLLCIGFIVALVVFEVRHDRKEQARDASRTPPPLPR